VSKLANPWKCDNPACGILRANDTNHWLIISVGCVCRKIQIANEGEPLPELTGHNADPILVISPWNDGDAERIGAKHACGIDCGLRIAASLIAENFFPGDSPAGKEGSRGES